MTQNQFQPKKITPQAVFLLIFVENAYFPTLFTDFGVTFHEISVKKLTYLCRTARVFFHLATFTKHCILHIERHFFIFCIVCFSRKKHQKLTSKYDPDKKPKKMPSWDLKYNENSLKCSSKIAEILKIAKKCCF